MKKRSFAAHLDPALTPKRAPPPAPSSPRARMDRPANMPRLEEIGALAAERSVQPSRFDAP